MSTWIRINNNFGVYRPGNYKGYIQTPLSRLHLDRDSNPGPPGPRSRALPQSYMDSDKTKNESEKLLLFRYFGGIEFFLNVYGRIFMFLIVVSTVRVQKITFYSLSLNF